MAVESKVYPNGVNVEQLVETVNAIKGNPDLAKFNFRATSEWVEGGYSKTYVKGFYGAGQEDSSRTKPFVLEGDEPPVLLGNNKAPNAIEVVLNALASCIIVGISYNAAAMGINIRNIELDLDGDVDLHGFLALSDKVRPGLSDVRVKYRIDSDATPEQLDQLIAHVKNTSPVMDTLRNPVNVTISG